MPDSAMVGTVGRATKRLPEVTARARSSPDLMWGPATAGVANWMSNCWLNCAITAGPEPL